MDKPPAQGNGLAAVAVSKEAENALCDCGVAPAVLCAPDRVQLNGDVEFSRDLSSTLLAASSTPQIRNDPEEPKNTPLMTTLEGALKAALSSLSLAKENDARSTRSAVPSSRRRSEVLCVDAKKVRRFPDSFLAAFPDEGLPPKLNALLGDKLLGFFVFEELIRRNPSS